MKLGLNFRVLFVNLSLDGIKFYGSIYEFRKPFHN